ncbi:ty3-gypsy retrotransposon protein [Cucumis melo var. makuwa]|uniref:Ty3-gypsy retrotransposon protein n=1 Tax=Cucumis melo var. makuwa TaxID=1194695 RepID=A0A5A7U1Z6_CUCMM|nr:ty3-gypsy retrotransposon protein [Cucumis melo var. makuwa]TYK08258.1 ty3-gypsy retrotransposon protein [Cucumis melo var. makuwa]
MGGGSQREHPFRRWTDSKLQELQLCVVADDLDDAEMGEIKNEGAMVEVSPVVKLSLNSVVGLTTPDTFKTKGMVEDREIVSMIDCGATHNFISLKLVEEVNIPTAETTNYRVIMGSGKAMQGKGMCKGVTMELPVLTIVDDFLPLELDNLDMVLGIQWLLNQGTMIVDWKELAMTFVVGDSNVILKEDPSLTGMEVSLKMLVK